MTPQNVDLHDALLNRASLDVVNNALELEISFYASDQANERTPARFKFQNVQSIQSLCDLASMAKNKFAGNINCWHIGDDGTPTYIYLNEGCLIIMADEPTVEAC